MFRRTRLPSPQPGRRSRPDIAFTIFVQTFHGRAETAVISIALDAALLNRAESPGGNRTTGPDVTILNQRIDVPSSELWVRSQLADVPTCEPLERTDPKGPVACSE